MGTPLYLSSLSALLFCSIVLAVPFDGSFDLRQLTARQTINCTDPSAYMDSSCWDTLQVADYLISWNETTPTCTGNQDGTDCCTNQESWETCFLRLSTGLGDFRYDERSGNFCNQSIINVRPDLESPARDQARYVNGAICYMHSFFASFYDRIRAVEALPDPLNDILTTGFKLNPRDNPTDYERISPPGVLIGQLPIPMTLGLSIANLTAWNDTKIAAIAGLWSSAIRATPQVQQVLWGTNAALNAQQQSLAIAIPPRDTAASLLYDALALILSDIPTFLAFAGEGRFTTGNTPIIPPELDIAAGVKTFVASKLMQADGMYAVPGRLVDNIADAATAGENKNGVYYRSPSTRRQYELRSKGQTQMPLRTLLDNVLYHGWADPQLLFDGNYNCTAAGWAGAGIVNRVGEVGGGDVSCLSQLPMYLEKGTPCPTDVLVGGRCPFGYLG